jgi:hypothetical protein
MKKITEKTKYSRNCPNCNKILFYSSEKVLKKVLKNNKKGPCCKRNTATIEQEFEILELIKSNTQLEVANKLNLTLRAIKKVLEKNNLKLPLYRLNKRKLNIDIDFFKKIDSNEKAYWLGFICADGCILKTCDKVSLFVADKEVIEKYKKSLKSEHAITTCSNVDKRTNKVYTRYGLSISSKIFKQNLINLGVTPEKTDKLEMPKIDEKYYSYFFAGLFDGDGSLTYRKSGYMICNQIGTKEVLQFLQNYLDIKSTKLLKITENKCNVWKLYLYKDAEKFLNWIYQDPNFPYLQRKVNKYRYLE